MLALLFLGSKPIALVGACRLVVATSQICALSATDVVAIARLHCRLSLSRQWFMTPQYSCTAAQCQAHRVHQQEQAGQCRAVSADALGRTCW